MSALRPQPRPGVLDIEAYVPGKSSAPGVAKVFKLSSNETPLGPSPRAIAAYQAVAAHLEDYPDGSAIGAARSDRTCLRARSRPHRLRRRLRRSFAPVGARLSRRRRRGDPHHARFLVYPIATLGTGATPVVAPETNYTADVDAILAR
jgi:histidinol-phosphate aminotransferase